MTKLQLKYILCICYFTIACVVFPFGYAHAITPLKYSDDISTSLRFQIDGFLKEQYNTDSSQFSIASFDLNGDGVQEHILRRKSCNLEENDCTHIIIAEKRDRILLLSKIRARRLMVDSKSSYGIKNLLAFKNELNDYNFDIYMWSPKEKLYIIVEQQTKD
tara:strand:+ start:3332 stop:3814 length:483 start_codon:yes stop_codon:yes gene_type:complete